MPVKNALDPKPLTILPQATIFDLLEAILNTRHTTGVVIDEAGKLLGVVGAQDILRKILPKYLHMDPHHNLMDIIHEGYFEEKFAQFKETPVTDVMREATDFVHPEDATIKAVAMLVEKGRKTLPVIDSDGTFVGLVTRRSVLQLAYNLFK